jgi:hypothetical protein
VFTARYALSPHIKQIRFVFKGLIRSQVMCSWHNKPPVFSKAFFTFKIHTVSRYTSKYHFPYAHTKRTAFPMPIFTKLTNVQQHYAQISYKGSHPTWTINVGSTNRNSLTCVTKARISRHRFSRNSRTRNTEFHSNQSWNTDSAGINSCKILLLMIGFSRNPCLRDTFS